MTEHGQFPPQHHGGRPQQPPERQQWERQRREQQQWERQQWEQQQREQQQREQPQWEQPQWEQPQREQPQREQPQWEQPQWEQPQWEQPSDGGQDGGWQQPPEPQAEPKNGFGLTALIIGLAGLLLGLVPLTGIAATGLGITGLVIGSVGFGRLRRKRATNHRTTYAGLAVSLVAVGLGIWGITIVFGAAGELGRDLNELGNQAEDAAGAETGTTGPPSAQNPTPAGQPVDVGDWRMSITGTNLDAGAAVAVENTSNGQPADGHQFVMSRVNLVYNGDETGQPAVDLTFSILSTDGSTYGGADSSCGAIPNGLDGVGEMVPGAAAAGNVCVSVPADQLEGAVWFVDQRLWVDAAQAFIALG